MELRALDGLPRRSLELRSSIRVEVCRRVACCSQRVACRNSPASSLLQQPSRWLQQATHRQFHNIKDELTIGHYHFTDSAYADDATILMSDQLQADSVLQSMPLMLYTGL